MRLLGLDPGLRHTGWGVVDADGNRLRHVASGVVHSRLGAALAERLVDLFRQLNEVLDRYRPEAAAVEETFVNRNPASTLKLGVARGVVLLAPAERGIPVHEYSTNLVKKSVVGVGHADKAQVQMMVRRLLPGCTELTADAADALAVAICHAHHAATAAVWSSAARPPHPPIAVAMGPSLSPGGRGGDASVAAIPPLPPGERAGVRGPLPPISQEAKRKPAPIETSRARRLRQDGTDVERILWQRLRGRNIEKAKFRRQEPILGFIADFVCHERRLVVELDGGQHAFSEEADARRSRILEQAGFRVLRFWNSDVIENLDGVLETIWQNLAEAPRP